jgi:hypothetical protein
MIQERTNHYKEGKKNNSMSHVMLDGSLKLYDFSIQNQCHKYTMQKKTTISGESSIQTCVPKALQLGMSQCHSVYM